MTLFDPFRERKEKQETFLFLAAGLVILLVLLLFSTNLRTRSREAWLSEKKTLGREKSLIQAQEKNRREWEEVRLKWPVGGDPASEQVSFLTNLQEEARKAGLSLLSIKPASPRPGPLGSELRASLQLEGSLEGVLYFIESLEKGARPTGLRFLSLKRKGTGPGQLEILIEMMSWVFSEEGRGRL